MSPHFARAAQAVCILLFALPLAVDEATAQGDRFVLAEGAQVRVERSRTLPSGSVALYIQVLTAPHKDEHVWVYWHLDASRRTLRLIDGDGRETQEPARAALAVAKTGTLAVAGFDAFSAILTGGPPRTTQDRPVATETQRAPAIVTIPRTAEPRISTTPFLVNLCGPMGAACTTSTASLFLQPTRQSQSDDPQIQALARKIVQDSGAGTDPVKITRAIHDWVAVHVPYDWPAYARYLQDPNNLSGYPVDAKSVLQRGSAGSICAGYSNLVTALSRAAGVPAVTIEGVVKYHSDGKKTLQCGRPLTEQRAHAWNLIWINGQWMPMDVTWDRVSTIGAGPTPTVTTAVTFSYDLGAPRWTWTGDTQTHLQCKPTPIALGRLPAPSAVATNSQGAD